jgi:hypothetical protein
VATPVLPQPRPIRRLNNLDHPRRYCCTPPSTSLFTVMQSINDHRRQRRPERSGR